MVADTPQGPGAVSGGERAPAEAAALRASEERFHSVVSLIPAAVYGCDADGRITFYNERAVALWGGAPALHDHAHRWYGTHRLFRPDGSPLPLDQCPMAVALREQRSVRGAELVVQRPDGTPTSILVNSDPIRNAAGAPAGVINIFTDITDYRRMEREREELHRRLTAKRLWLRSILKQMPVGVLVAEVPSGRLVLTNEAVEGIFGPDWQCTDIIEACRAWRPHRADGEPYDCDQVPIMRALRTGETVVGEEMKFPRPDGGWLHVSINAAPVRDAAGNRTHAVSVFQDITERKLTEEHTGLMTAELRHRVKNTLATVRSIAVQTLHAESDPVAAFKAFDGRLAAMAHAHTLLAESDWHGASLRKVIEAELRPFECAVNRRTRVEGPDVQLTPRAALTLAMAVHELAANAAKSGALSSPSGRVDLSWTVLRGIDAPHLRLIWHESSGPPVKPPTQRGFGRSFIERGIGHELNGTARMEYRPEGLHCEIDAPLQQATP